MVIILSSPFLHCIVLLYETREQTVQVRMFFSRTEYGTEEGSTSGGVL